MRHWWVVHAPKVRVADKHSPIWNAAKTNKIEALFKQPSSMEVDSRVFLHVRINKKESAYIKIASQMEAILKEESKLL